MKLITLLTFVDLWRLLE